MSTCRVVVSLLSVAKTACVRVAAILKMLFSNALRIKGLSLRTYFKLTSFRPGHLDAILPVLHGKDVFACIPTGISLCMYIDGVGVISCSLLLMSR